VTIFRVFIWFAIECVACWRLAPIALQSTIPTDTNENHRQMSSIITTCIAHFSTSNVVDNQFRSVRRQFARIAFVHSQLGSYHHHHTSKQQQQQQQQQQLCTSARLKARIGGDLLKRVEHELYRRRATRLAQQQLPIIVNQSKQLSKQQEH
jgi:hypothetical protein